MPETSDTDTAVAAATDAAEGAPDAPPADAPAPEPQPWEGKTPEELWKASEKIREENISYKDRFRPWEQTVGDMHPADQTVIREFLSAINSRDPERIATEATRMRAALDQLSPAEQQAVADATAAATDEYDPYDAKAQEARLEKMLDERLKARDEVSTRERAIEQAQAKMAERATSLSQKHEIADLADPTTNLGRLLYITANQQFQTEPDPMARLDLAAQAIVDDLRKQGQKLLKAKGADAAPSPAPADAAQPTGARKPLTLEDAKRSALARIEAAESVG